MTMVSRKAKEATKNMFPIGSAMRKMIEYELLNFFARPIIKTCNKIRVRWQPECYKRAHDSWTAEDDIRAINDGNKADFRILLDKFLKPIKSTEEKHQIMDEFNVLYAEYRSEQQISQVDMDFVMKKCRKTFNSFTCDDFYGNITTKNVTYTTIKAVRALQKACRFWPKDSLLQKWCLLDEEVTTVEPQTIRSCLSLNKDWQTECTARFFDWEAAWKKQEALEESKKLAEKEAREKKAKQAYAKKQLILAAAAAKKAKEEFDKLTLIAKEQKEIFQAAAEKAAKASEDAEKKKAQDMMASKAETEAREKANESTRIVLQLMDA